MSRKEENTFIQQYLTVAKINQNKEAVNNVEQTETNESTSSLDLDISLDDIDWNEPFELEERKSKAESLLPDIADINCSDVFPEINTSSISREDHSVEFKGNYPFSENMLEVLQAKFGLRNFRPQQREIINAILNGHDCFVLMPTGGGKSLCYQLPAILSNGVTIVISPLISLITDQVDKLSVLNIKAAHLCSTNSRQETDDILSKLGTSEPEIDLLYVTPEKIIGSIKTKEAIDALYKRGKLSRFVLDEVHCLSLWGHDFRPHYKQLCTLRKKYSDVQIICFTATATEQVETDVIVNLNLQRVKRFIQSFNRPNIKYQVVMKHGEMSFYEIAQLISNKFSSKSGIIYCLYRHNCADLSNYLNRMGIRAKPYHAGLKAEVRKQTQKAWMQDQINVIVATTAFGMGIDKPDVRFVIHNNIPKSIEDYYQQSGRAGRDGQISFSYLYFNYYDIFRIMSLMKQNFHSQKTLEGHFDNLQQMVAFAINEIDCRRYLQLINLGEHFDRQLCMQNRETVCDNCANYSGVQKVDITKEAKQITILVRDITAHTRITLITAMKIYKGLMEPNIFKRGFHLHKYYGSGKQMSRLDIYRILRDLVVKNVLANDYIETGEFPIVYIKPGEELQSFLDSWTIKLVIPVANKQSIQTECIETEYSVSVAVNRRMMPSAAALQYLTKNLKLQCYHNLLDLCYRLALKTNISVSAVLHPTAIKGICNILPTDQEELLKIPHVTISVFNKYGMYILKITNHFSDKIKFLKGENRGVSNPLKRTYFDAFLSNNNSYK